MTGELLDKRGFTKLLVFNFLLFVLSGAAASLILYGNLPKPSGPHFEAIVTSVSSVKETLVYKTLLIGMFMFFFTAAAVIFMGIVYSHRIAGPLFKARQFIEVLGDGHFENRISFREKDSVKGISHELNELAESCMNKSESIDTKLEELEKNLKSLASVSDKEEQKKIIEKLKEIDIILSMEDKKIMA